MQKWQQFLDLEYVVTENKQLSVTSPREVDAPSPTQP